MTILHYMVSMGLHKTVWIPAHKYQHRNLHPLLVNWRDTSLLLLQNKKADGCSIRLFVCREIIR